MLNHSGVHLPILWKLLFSVSRSAVTLCAAMPLSLCRCAHIYQASLLPCSKTEAVLTSPFCLASALRLSLFSRLLPSSFSSFHAYNITLCSGISWFQLLQLIVHCNIILSAEEVEFFPSCFQDCSHSLLSQRSHLFSLPILSPLLSFSILPSKKLWSSLYFSVPPLVFSSWRQV